MFLATNLERVSHPVKLVRIKSIKGNSVNRIMVELPKTKKTVSYLWDELKFKKTQIEQAQ